MCGVVCNTHACVKTAGGREKVGMEGSKRGGREEAGREGRKGIGK